MRQTHSSLAKCLLISEKPPEEQNLLVSRRTFQEQSWTENNQLPLINCIQFYCITDGFKLWPISLSNTKAECSVNLSSKIYAKVLIQLALSRQPENRASRNWDQFASNQNCKKEQQIHLQNKQTNKQQRHRNPKWCRHQTQLHDHPLQSGHHMSIFPATQECRMTV